MEKIRSFLAIEIPAILHSKMEELQKKLKEAAADVKWVAPSKVHLTLKFFGAIPPEKIEKAVQALLPIAAHWRPFSMEISGLGCFPSKERPRVIWLGINKGHQELSLLQKEVEEELVHVGFPAEERPFSPHLTLGRVRSGRGLNALLAMIMTYQNFEVGSFGVKEIVVFKSDLNPTGAIYTPLRTLAFQGL